MTVGMNYDELEEEYQVRCEDCVYGILYYGPRDQGNVKMICTSSDSPCYGASVNRFCLRQCSLYLPPIGV